MSRRDTKSAAAAPPLVIMQTRSGTESRLIRAWVAEHHPRSKPVKADRRTLQGELEDGGRQVIPVRVVWTPPEREDAGTRLADLMAMPIQRKPWPALHATLHRVRPANAVVVEGDAASCDELRAAFVHEADGHGDFHDFVVRRAVLACERAERRLVGDRYKVPRLIVEQITAAPQFHLRAAEVALKVGVGPKEFVDKATKCLTEMVAVQSPPAIDTFRALTSPLHSKTWSVDVDTSGVEKLRELNRTAPLVFLPSHRSYVDPLVLAEVLHRHDFPRNHVLGGDNMSFWPFGSIGRRAGIVFIRRSFGDDAFYKFAIREYLGHLMAKRFNLEWYIEGGRTRTGKLRRPRYGLLRYLVDAMEHDPSRDAIFVPVSIMYEQLHEVGAMADEQSGGRKRTEGMQWFARYLRDQSKHIGEARVRFGEPFSLKEALAEAGEGSAQLEKVAFRVCEGINQATPVMATSVVTFALLNTGGRALTFSQLAAVVEPLLDYLEVSNVASPVSDLRKADYLRSTLDRLSEGGVITCYDAGDEPVWSIVPGRDHVAAFYRNGSVHHLVNRAIAELGLLLAERDELETDLESVGTDQGLRFRDLLKFEFFFPAKTRFLQDIEAELDLIGPHDRGEPSGQAATRLLDSCRTLVAPRAVRAVFDSQLVVAELLVAQDSEEPLEIKPFLDRCLTVGRQMLLQGRVSQPDSVSGELYDSALRLAANRGLVKSDAPDLAGRRQVFLDDVTDVIDLLDRAAKRDALLIDAVLTKGGTDDDH